MYKSIWKTLGIERTKDTKTIKKAFAEKTKLIHPEEDPDGFMELNNAYKSAMNYANYKPSRIPAAKTNGDIPHLSNYTVFNEPSKIEETSYMTSINFDELNISKPIDYKEYITYLEKNVYLCTSFRVDVDPKIWIKIINSETFNQFMKEPFNVNLFLDMILKYKSYINLQESILSFLDELKIKYHDNKIVLNKIDKILAYQNKRHNSFNNKKSREKARKIYNKTNSTSTLKENKLKMPFLMRLIVLIYFFLLMGALTTYIDYFEMGPVRTATNVHIASFIIFGLLIYVNVKVTLNTKSRDYVATVLMNTCFTFAIIQGSIIALTCRSIAETNNIMLSLSSFNALSYVYYFSVFSIIIMTLFIIIGWLVFRKEKNVL